tara:strand:- start:897 stop:2666 length:1770 start_codon:yes stop_codon:yes gene_type:complete
MKPSNLFFTIVFFILAYSNSISQTIPTYRTVDWTEAGIVSQQVNPSLTINFISSGGVGNGTTANDSVFNTILNSINQGDSAIIYFPHGNYLFNQSLNLRSNIFLVGQSSDSSFLTFDLNGSGDLIKFSGSSSIDTAHLIAPVSKGSNYLSFSSSNLFNAGDFIQLIDNDTAKIKSTWAAESSGQIVRVVSINGSTIQVNKKIRRYYSLNDRPYIKRLNMIENNKIESLSITRLDSTVGQTSNINFNYSYNSKINCIKSYNCNFSHIEINYSSNIEVEGSYFQDSYGYGSGGRAYGIVLQFTTGDCFVYNNKFNHLRHSMIMQAGANGNVIAYNYSTNPFWTGTNLPSDAAGDLVLHGNYVYANLFEGNSVQNIVIDNSHGINGPYNTFFRNRVNSYGIVMNTPEETDTANFVGNEIPNTGFFKGNYILAGNSHFQHGNNVRGTLTPSGTSSLPDSSYYFNLPPSYYTSNSYWPPIGTPNSINTNSTESEANYNVGILTQCYTPLLSSINKPDKRQNEFIVYPNPFQNSINIRGSIHVAQVNIYSMTGNLIYHSNKAQDSIEFSPYADGLYVIQLITFNGETFSKKLVKE